MVEIACPADCRYLNEGQDFQRYKTHMAQLSSLEQPQERMRVLQTLVQFGPVLEELEKAVVRYAAGLRTLGDRHVEEAIGQLEKNYRTESRGIIYEELEAIFAGDKTAQEGLDSAVSRGNALLRKFEKANQ